MSSDHSICILLVACLVILDSCAIFYTNAATGDVEPPFPQIISPLQVNRHKIHIVSESVSDKFGYETYEELVDLDEGKDTLLVHNKKGHYVTHIDGPNNLIFRYQPYTCAAFTPEELELGFLDSLWAKKYSMKSNDGKTTKEMHLYGVTALWMNVAERPKAYSSSSMIYSASKDIAKNAHKWTVRGDDNKTLVHFYFIDNSARSSGTKLSLEMIQVESLVSMKIVQTLNILSFEYSFSDSYDSMMRVPVGYGCINSDVTARALIEFPSIESLYMGPLMSNSHKIQLEATATKFKETNDGIERSSDTISYEIAHTSPVFSTGNPGLQLIRQRDTKRDIKTVSNHQFNVEYKIDMRKGTCKFANMGLQSDKGERLSLEFNNDLKLAIDVETFKAIFVDTDDFYFIGRSKKVIEYLYFEKTTDKIFGGGKQSRIIRTYSINRATTGEVELESVTIWVFDEKFENIIESYHLNVIDAITLNSFYELSRTFDITEECYLNNENMVEGKDYSWFELHYPVQARYNSIIASKVMTVKEMIYTRFSSDGINFFLAPRFEIMFEDTGFILRVLQIDIPSINYLYDLKEGFSLSIDATQGDAEDLTVDLNHCTDLCRLSNCKTMSYCENDHLCLISTNLPDNNKRKLYTNKSCMTYLRPTLNPVEEESDELFEKIMELKLQRVISVLQHQDYDALSLPKMPDELWYPRSETGINEEEYNKILNSYLEEVINFIKSEGHRLPMLTFTLEIEGALVILMPNKFELEQDPLSEFKLTDEDDSLENGLGSSSAAAMPFHEGLTMQRFKINAFNEANQQNSRLFTGLNYDQCALACVDGKCSSFSFCSHRQECIITDIYTIGESMNNIIEYDSDCMIMQRDFLSKFNRFQNVFRPNIYKKSTKAFNASECAHTCVIETDFKCLAFDFCSTSGSSSTKQSVELNSCLLLEDRQIYTGIESVQKDQQNPTSANKQSTNDNTKKKKKQQVAATGCDHYSRSYLADFLRFEYRQIDDSEMLKLKTSIIEGRSVDQCADECVNQLTDCTAFQFCFDPDIKDGAMQSCTFIESKPEGTGDNKDASSAAAAASTSDTSIVVDEKDGGKVVKASKLFVTNRNCHVFSLRHDTSEAHLRELALNGMTKEEMETNEQMNKVQSSGISIGGGILLFLSVTLIFSAIGCGIVVVKHHNDYVRQRIERIQLLLGI